MRLWFAALACALTLPATAMAAQIDLKTGGWHIVSIQPDGTKGAVQKECLSEKDLQDMRMFLPPDSEADCKVQGVSQTKTSLEMKATCTGEMPGTLSISIKADNPKKFVATLTALAGGTTQSMKMSADWVQDSCDGFND